MTTDPNAIANAIVAGVDPVPSTLCLDGTYSVWLDGKQYTVEFRDGRPERVEVTFKVEAGWRRTTGRQSRWLWGADRRDRREPAPGTVPAKLVAMVRDPALAAKAGAKVESPDQRAARWRAADDKAAAEARLAKQAAKLAEAAPAMLAALKALVAAGSYDETMAAMDAARAAIAQAEGNV